MPEPGGGWSRPLSPAQAVLGMRVNEQTRAGGQGCDLPTAEGPETFAGASLGAQEDRQPEPTSPGGRAAARTGGKSANSVTPRPLL